MPDPGLTLGRRAFVWALYRGRRRVAHIAELYASGEVACHALCGRYGFPIMSNMPWGRRRCLFCIKALDRAQKNTYTKGSA